MPHVNYARGETRSFVFRREHGILTFRNHYKSKRDSWKWHKTNAHRKRRAMERRWMHADIETLPKRFVLRTLRYDLG